jgi:tetratricopeptide (TPR) repeat protein
MAPDQGSPGPHLELKWRQIQDLFHGALERPEGQRGAWLAGQMAESTVLAEVQSLLASFDREAVDSAAAQPTQGVPRPQTTMVCPTVPSAQFGAYRAIELLAQGGMSSVYRAERADGHFDQVVALKVMAAYLGGPEFLRRFETERQLLAALNHNNITRLLDGGVSSAGDPFLITEFVQGETIDRYCDRRKLSLEDRLRIFLQVCDAVDHAHRNLIVHRDLKPGNILVNEQCAVKLLDFGTASLMAAGTDVTSTGMRMLTPRYASPEQLRGERVNTATDVFSLGVVLYELLTGAWPFGDPASVLSELGRASGDVSAKSPATVVTAESAELRSLSQQNLARILKGDLTGIVLKAIETDPARRYESVFALAADIQNYLDGRPVLARAQTAWYRAGKFLRRRSVPATAAAIFVLGLFGSTLFAMHQARVARAEAQNAAVQARKAEKVSQFLNDMLSSAGEFAFEPRKFTVAQMLDAAQPRLEKSWKDDPVVEATLRVSLAGSYLAMQRFDEAKVQLDKALATFRSLRDTLGEAKTLATMGTLYDSIGQREESVRQYRSALEKFDRLGKDAPALQVFWLKNNLAFDLHRYLNRDPGDARRLIAEALDLAARDPSIPKSGVVQAQSAQAEIWMAEGKTAEAETLLLRAAQTGRQEDNGRAALLPLEYLLVLNARKGNFIAAAGFAGERYHLTLRDLGPDHVNTAVAEMDWARQRAEIGEQKEVVQQVHEAMRILHKAYPPLSSNLWQPTSGAASVLNHAGRYQEAEAYARELIAECDAEHLAEADARRAESLSRLGTALLGQHRKREAIEILSRSATDYEQTGPIWAKRAAQIRLMIGEAR